MYRYLLFASIFFLAIPYSASIILMSLYARELGASYFEIGTITATYSVVPLFMAVHMGRFIDRYGERVPLIIGMSGIIAALVLLYCCPFIQVLYVSQLLLGASQMFAVVALQNGSAASVPIENRERVLANFSLFASTGMFLGPLVCGYLVEYWGFQTTYLVLACITVIPLLLTKFVRGSSGSDDYAEKIEKTKSKIFLEVTRNSILVRAIVISMISLTAADLFFVYFPLVGSAAGLSVSQIGWIVAIQGMAYVVVRFFLPGLITRFGRNITLYLFILTSAFAYGSIPFFSNFNAFAIIALIMGFGLGIAQPVTLMLTYNNAPRGRTAEVLSLRLASNRLAQLTLPILLAAISQYGGLTSIFVIQSLILIFGAYIAKGIRSSDDHHSSV